MFGYLLASCTLKDIFFELALFLHAFEEHSAFMDGFSADGEGHDLGEGILWVVVFFQAGRLGSFEGVD
jgi:hypothetical protein